MRTTNFSALLLVIFCLTALSACGDYKNGKTSETASKGLHDENMAEWHITRSEESLASQKPAGGTNLVIPHNFLNEINMTRENRP